MKKLIGKAAGALLAAGCVISAASLSGCSDFSFNPVGSWTLTSDILYRDGEFDTDLKADYILTRDDETGEEKYIYIGNTVYQFGKSGTGLVFLDDESGRQQTADFTYSYTDTEVHLFMMADYARKMNYDSVEIVLKPVLNDKGETTLVTERSFEDVDDSGVTRNYTEVQTFTKS